MDIRLTDGRTIKLTSAREELKLKATHAQELYDAHRGSTLELGRYLKDVRDSGLAAAMLKAQELRDATDKDARSTGFSLWYQGIGLNRSEVDRWIHFAEVVDRFKDVPEVQSLSQDAALALRTVKDPDQARAIIDRAKDQTGKLTTNTLRDARKSLEPDPDPGTDQDSDSDQGSTVPTPEELDGPSDIDRAIGTILSLNLGRTDLASVVRTSDIDTILAAANALHALANAVKDQDDN